MTWRSRFCYLVCPKCDKKEVGWRGEWNKARPGKCSCGATMNRKRIDWLEVDETAIVNAILDLISVSNKVKEFLQ